MHVHSDAGSDISELISFVRVMQIRLTCETRGAASPSAQKAKGASRVSER